MSFTSLEKEQFSLFDFLVRKQDLGNQGPYPTAPTPHPEDRAGNKSPQEKPDNGSEPDPESPVGGGTTEDLPAAAFEADPALAAALYILLFLGGSAGLFLLARNMRLPAFA